MMCSSYKTGFTEADNKCATKSEALTMLGYIQLLGSPRDLTHASTFHTHQEVVKNTVSHQTQKQGPLSAIHYCNSRDGTRALQGVLKTNKASIGYLVAQNPELH